MIGVAKDVFPFLIVVLLFTIFGFACAFYILLSPTDNSSETNIWLFTSLLAMYLFLTGNNLFDLFDLIYDYLRIN